MSNAHAKPVSVKVLRKEGSSPLLVTVCEVRESFAAAGCMHFAYKACPSSSPLLQNGAMCMRKMNDALTEMESEVMSPSPEASGPQPLLHFPQRIGKLGGGSTPVSSNIASFPPERGLGFPSI